MTTLRRNAALSSTLAALLPAALLLAGCRVGPKYVVPAPTVTAPPAAAYKEAPAADTDGWKVAQPQDAMLRGKWWEVFNEPELNTLEDQLNINNQNIKQSFENFMAARALIAQARAQLYPTLSVAPSWSRSRSSANLGKSGTANAGQQSSITSMSASASWAPDLWGKVRNLISEDKYNAQLSAADLENERLTEQSSLATFFFELRGQDALRQIFDETIAADQKTLDYNQAQYELGIGDKISVVEAQNTLQNAIAGGINLGVARAQYEHGIAMLIGVPASNFSIPVKPLLKTPPAIPVGMPSQLLERRPDIAAAERSMAAANAQIGIAYAAYYPNLTLSAQGGFESSVIGSLFDGPSRFWSIGPAASETIFDAGLRRATINQDVALFNADVAGYRQTVLNAFQQVEDGLSTVRVLDQQIKEQELAQKSAQEFVSLEIDRFQLGIDPYIDVVTAQTTLLSDRQTLATLHVQQMTASISLVEALGGGWDRTQLPTPDEVGKKLTRVETQIAR